MIKRSRTFVLFAILTSLIIATLASPTRADMSASAILDKVDDLYRGDSSIGRVTMLIKTEHWSRELTMDIWSKGKDKSLIRILSPRKEKGTATLRNGNDIWNFLPKVKRVIKLPSSMMSDSWMDSHFTNNDLVKESRMADDYTYEITFTGKRDGMNIIEITCIPKPDAVVVWGKVVVVVNVPDYMPQTIAYYDEDMDLARTMTFGEVVKFGSREMPSVMMIIPADEPEEYTKVTYEEMDFDVDVGDGFFSLRNLQK